MTIQRKGRYASTKPSWFTRFSAVVRYELLWNIRKKKLLGVIVLAFALATLSLALPVILSNITDQPLEANPDYAVNTGTGVGGLGFFLFAIVTVMNSISGEFESGTIIPLLTKPVSRTTIFLGKIFAAFLTLLGAYTVLIVYLAAGGAILYGPQSNLHLLPLVLLGNITSTFVWISIVLALGSFSKSSMIAALISFGIWLGLAIVLGIVSFFSGETWVLTYAPGTGATGYILGADAPSLPMPVPGLPVTTGTDSIGSNLVNFILHPGAEVTFYKFVMRPGGSAPQEPIYTETLPLILSRAIATATVYILTFNLIAWYALKRAQVME